MDNNHIFDPMAWASANESPEANNSNDQQKAGLVNNPQPAVPLGGNELDKAKATVDEILRLGANIAESYSDWWDCGCALSELGPEARELFHQVSSQSTKYREADCEKKWQECLSKRDGRITIATFYKMAQQAGVDLSAISRQFPSKPSFPHVSLSNTDEAGNQMVKSSEDTYNNGILNTSTAEIGADGKITEGSEGMREIEGNSLGYNDSEPLQYTETFSNKIDITTLASLIRDPVMTQTDDEGHDKVLLASLTLYSGAMPNVFGIYDSKRVYPPIYTLIDAPTGADKGKISDCRELLMPIEHGIRRRYEHLKEEYLNEYARWAALDKKERAKQQEPQKPPFQSLFIPANSSATACYQALADNGEWGVIFETEADTLAQAIKQDYGDYSDGLRKAFHHETISYNRRKDDEHVYIDCPRLASLLTCTPGQIPMLLSPQQIENGLANRFMFYNLKGNHEWRDVFAQCDEPLSDRFRKIGERYLELYKILLERKDNNIQFVLSVEQQKQFNNYFKSLLFEQIGLHGEQLDAFVKRLGLSTFRIAMVLTVLRYYDLEQRFDPKSQTIVCSDEDFTTAKTIADCLINHTAHVYANLLPHDEQPISGRVQQLSTQELALYRSLGAEFTTQECQQAAAKLNIPWKTAERYLGQFVSKYHLIDRVKNGHYRKKNV